MFVRQKMQMGGLVVMPSSQVYNGVLALEGHAKEQRG